MAAQQVRNTQLTPERKRQLEAYRRAVARSGQPAPIPEDQLRFIPPEIVGETSRRRANNPVPYTNDETMGTSGNAMARNRVDASINGLFPRDMTPGLMDAGGNNNDKIRAGEKKAAGAEADRKRKIEEGRASVDEHLAQFDPAYFQGIVDKYVTNYMPQLDQQYGDAQNLMLKSLAAKGITGSSIATGKFGRMQQEYNTSRDTIASRGVDERTAAQNQVEDLRMNLYQQLEAGMRPGDAGSAAAAGAAQFAAPRTYSPLGNVFSTFMDTAATALAAEGQGYPGTGFNVFGRRSGGSQRTVT